MAHLDCECVYPSHHTTNNTPLIAASCRTRGWARTPLWCPWPLVSLSFVAPHLPTHTNATPPPTGLEPGPDLHRGAPRQHRPDAGRLRASGGRRRELLQGALQVGGRCVGVGVHVRVCVATAVVARADSICNQHCKWLLSVLSFSLTQAGTGRRGAVGGCVPTAAAAPLCLQGRPHRAGWGCHRDRAGAAAAGAGPQGAHSAACTARAARAAGPAQAVTPQHPASQCGRPCPHPAALNGGAPYISSTHSKPLPPTAPSAPTHTLSHPPHPYTPQEAGLEQYAIVQYAAALEVVPRTLAENSGLGATEAISALYHAHAGGQAGAGLDVETGVELAECGISVVCGASILSLSCVGRWVGVGLDVETGAQFASLSCRAPFAPVCGWGGGCGAVEALAPTAPVCQHCSPGGTA